MKNTTLTLFTFLATMAILFLCFPDDASSKAKENPNVFQDNGMLVSNESRTYVLSIEKDVSVSFKVQGSNSNGVIKCVIYSNDVQIGSDQNSENACSIAFVSASPTAKYYFVLKNGEEIQNFAASVLY